MNDMIVIFNKSADDQEEDKEDYKDDVFEEDEEVEEVENTEEIVNDEEKNDTDENVNDTLLNLELQISEDKSDIIKIKENKLGKWISINTTTFRLTSITSMNTSL